MDSKILNKGSLFLVLLLVIIVVGVFFWQNPEVTFDKIKAMISPKISLSENSDSDLSEINIENLLGEEEKQEQEEENGIGGLLIGELPGGEEALEQEVVVLKKNLTLEEIQQEINEIAKEVERVDQEVKKLVALAEIQEGIDEITKKVVEIRTCLASLDRTLIR